MAKKASSNSKKTGKEAHILVIRLSAMGDVAMCVPVLLALVKQYPDLKITMLSKRFLKPLFDAIPNVYFEEAAVKSRHKGVSGLYKLFLELRKNKYSAVADLHAVIRSHVLSSFFKAAGLPVARIRKSRKEKKLLTRSKNKLFKPLKNTTERYADVFKKLGFPILIDVPVYLKKPPFKVEIAQKLPEKNQKWVGFAPFAAHLGKRYPNDQTEAVIQQLAELDFKVMLFGGGAEEVKILEQLVSKYKNCYNLAGCFSFAEELQIIAQLDVMIAMDSGNGHLAALYNIPVITVWGVTHPYLGFKPYLQPEENQLLPDREVFPLIPTSVYGNKMPAGYEKAIASISPKQIVNRVQDILLK